MSDDSLEDTLKELTNRHWELEEQCELMSSDTIELEIRKRELAIIENEEVTKKYNKKYSKITEPLRQMRHKEFELLEKEQDKLYARENSLWYRIKGKVFDRTDIWNNIRDEAEQNIRKKNRRFFRKMEKLEKKVNSFSWGDVILDHRLEEEIEVLKKSLTKSKKRERSARLAAYDDKARQGSQSLKKKLLSKIRGNSYVCPYCLTTTKKSELVLDHIHPIAKGGQTLPQNSVLVCPTCNSKKKALTLRVFCKKFDMDFDGIIFRLEKDDKWV